MTDRIHTLRDGRRLGLHVLGDPAIPRLVVLFHPAPGTGGFDPEPRVTEAHGVHLLAPDRPGYGASSTLPDEVRPTVARAADDVAELVHTTQLQLRAAGREPPRRVGAIGWSAGGRVALAFAARHPELVDKVAVVATPAPDSAVRWVPEEHARELAEVASLPAGQARERLRAVLQRQVPSGEPDPVLLGGGPDDAEILDGPGVRNRLTRTLREAFEQGAAGTTDDVLPIATDDWGFDLGAVQADTLLVYGAGDAAVPSAHGRWYRRALPHATLKVVPRSGHLVIVPAWQRILDHVAAHPGPQSE